MTDFITKTIKRIEQGTQIGWLYEHVEDLPAAFWMADKTYPSETMKFHFFFLLLTDNETNIIISLYWLVKINYPFL